MIPEPIEKQVVWQAWILEAKWHPEYQGYMIRHLGEVSEAIFPNLKFQ